MVAPGAAGLPQVGFVAGKRVGNAVKRNRAKRRLRAAMTEVGLANDTAYVVIAGRGVGDVAYRGLVGWLRTALEADKNGVKEDGT